MSTNLRRADTRISATVRWFRLPPIRRHSPTFPASPLPATNLRPPRLDLGPRFPTERIADIVPPIAGRPFETLVPRPSADGLDQGGIELPEILVPLGTYTGFNTRAEAAGFPWATGRWDGSFVPFPRTEAERRQFADPRPSLEARYTNRADYESRLRAGRSRSRARWLPARGRSGRSGERGRRLL